MNSLIKYFICILDATYKLGQKPFWRRIPVFIQLPFHKYLVKVLMDEIKNAPLVNISLHFKTFCKPLNNNQ